MKDTQLITYTVGKLLKDTYFRRGVCSIASVCGGGGGGAVWGGITGTIEDQTDLVSYVGSRLDTVNLQSVTDNGNTTTNVIQQSGIDNLDAGFDGISIYGVSGVAAAIANFATNCTLRFEPQKVTLGVFNTALVLNENQDSTTPGGQFGVSRVSGTAAINTDEFTTLGQVQDLVSSGGTMNVIYSSVPPAPLDANTYNTNTFDFEDVEWILPPITGNTGKRIGVINLPDVNITLNSNSGTPQIFDNGSLTASLIILPGTTKVFYNNGSSWVALT